MPSGGRRVAFLNPPMASKKGAVLISTIAIHREGERLNIKTRARRALPKKGKYLSHAARPYRRWIQYHSPHWRENRRPFDTSSLWLANREAGCYRARRQCVDRNRCRRRQPTILNFRQRLAPTSVGIVLTARPCAKQADSPSSYPAKDWRSAKQQQNKPRRFSAR